MKHFNLTTFTNRLFLSRFGAMPAPAGFVAYYLGDQWEPTEYVIEYKLGTPNVYQMVTDLFGEKWCLVPLGAIEKLSYQPQSGVIVRIEGDGETFVVKHAQNLDSTTNNALLKAGHLYAGARQPFVTVWCSNGHALDLDGSEVDITQQHVCQDCLIEFGLPRNYMAGSYHEAIVLTKLMFYFKNISLPVSPIKVFWSLNGYRVVTVGGRELMSHRLIEVLDDIRLPIVALRAYSMTEIAENKVPHLNADPLPTSLPPEIGAQGDWWKHEEFSEFLT